MNKFHFLCAVLAALTLGSCSFLEDEEIFDSFDECSTIGQISGDGVPTDMCFLSKGMSFLSRDEDGNIMPGSTLYAYNETDEYGSGYQMQVEFLESPGKMTGNLMEPLSKRVDAAMMVWYENIPPHAPGEVFDIVVDRVNKYHVKVRLSGSPELLSDENGEFLKGDLKVIMTMENNDRFLFRFNELSLVSVKTVCETYFPYLTWPDFPQIRFREN